MKMVFFLIYTQVSLPKFNIKKKFSPIFGIEVAKYNFFFPSLSYLPFHQWYCHNTKLFSFLFSVMGSQPIGRSLAEKWTIAISTIQLLKFLFSLRPFHIIYLSSLLLFPTTPLLKFISLLKQLSNFEQYIYHK